MGIEETDESGQTPLLVACEWSHPSFLTATLEYLLKKGSSIHARDKIGRGCLRTLLQNTYGYHRYNYGEREGASAFMDSLTLLIDAGADVFAADSEGLSVSQYAYQVRSAIGDIWDAALSLCGYNITNIRRGFHRRPRYRHGKYGQYDRSMFESLWTDAEHQCPYYDDPPLWCPDSTSPSGVCPYGGIGRFCPGYDAVRGKELDTPSEWWKRWHGYNPGNYQDWRRFMNAEIESEGKDLDTIETNDAYGRDASSNKPD
jgi:hypothetical protein